MKRLASLDVLRGADMVLLTMVGPVIWGMDAVWGLPPWLSAQFAHDWGSLRLWDLVMPLFVFACGAAAPLALPRRLGAGGRPGLAYWRHVLGRVAMLWVCGLVVQGNLLKLSLEEISPYCNTLQAIAAGYLIAAIAVPIRSRKVRFALPVALAAVYSALLAFGGDYTPDGNFAQRVEMQVLRAVLPASSSVLANGTSGYTWFLTTLMFGVMTLAGSAATDMLLDETRTMRRRSAALASAGAACFVLGLALSPFVPPVKHIYTVSFTALATGVSMLLYAGLFALCDVYGVRKGTGLAELFGRCSLFAYMVNNVFYGLLDSIGAAVARGTGRIESAHVPFYGAIVHVAVLAALVYAWRRFRQRRSGR